MEEGRRTTEDGGRTTEDRGRRSIPSDTVKNDAKNTKI